MPEQPQKSWTGICSAHGSWASATTNSCPSCRGVTMETLIEHARNEGQRNQQLRS